MITKYDELANTGVEWIGSLPSEWQIKPLYTVASESKISNKGMIENNLLSLSYGRVIKKDIETLSGLLPESFETYQIVNPDDTIFRLTDLQNDKRSLRSAICNERGIITSAYVAVTPLKIRPKYFNHLMRAYDQQKVFYNLGSGLRQSLKFSELKKLPIVLPPEDIQEQVEKYIDQETLRVDSLISEKQNFIILLEEKRQALITHVVTKGLDDKVEMKESGVEWIGGIPANWSMTKLKYVGKAIIGLTYSPDDVSDTGTLVLRSTNIQNGQISLHNNVYVTSDIPEKLRTQIDDILICSRNGSRKLIGKNALINENAVNETFGAFTTVFRTRYSKFIYYVLNSSLFNYQAGMFLTTTVNQLTTGMLNNFDVPLPPEDIQHDLVSYLDNKTRVINSLIEETIISLKLLKERRSALISAAVTGKIDVREEV